MKSSLIELKPRNIVRVEKRYEIHTNGHDNAYPTRFERLINASPTAKSCSKSMAKFIMGAGFAFKFPEETYVGKNEDGYLTPADVLKDCAHSISQHNAFALHVNYNLNAEIISVTPIDYKCLRYGLADSEGFKGKIIYYDNWDYSKSKVFKKDCFDVFDTFNPLKEVVLAQIIAAGGIEKYYGQVLIVKMENTVYPLSPLDPARDDADTEYQLQRYKNRTTRKGFVGKKILVTDEFDNLDNREAFQNDLKNIQGFDSSGDILHLETKFTGDEKKKMFEIAQLDSDLKTDQFNNWETSISNNIRRCFNSIPKVLVDVLDGTMFGASGESFRMAQSFYNSQTEEERAVITRTFKKIFTHFHEPINPNNNWSINQLNLIADGTITNQ